MFELPQDILCNLKKLSEIEADYKNIKKKRILSFQKVIVVRVIKN